MRTKMVAEHEAHFEMSDGRSPFKVPKQGLSESLQNKIRAMGEPRAMAAGGNVLASFPERMGSAPVAYDQFGQPVPNFAPADAGPFGNINAQPVAPVVPDGGQLGNINAPPQVAAEHLAREEAVQRLDTAVDPAKAQLDAEYARAIPTPGGGRLLGQSRLPPGVRPEGSEAPAAAPPPPPLTPPQVAPPARGSGGAGMAGMSDIRGGTEAQKDAAMQSASIAGEVGRQQADELSAYGRQVEANMLEDKRRQAESAQRTAALMSDYKAAQDEMKNISATVDPGRFWASKSTGGKIAGIIGLALGALGAGPDGVNRAAQMLNQAIDRDLDAQKAEHTIRMQKGKVSIDAATSAFAMERQRFGDDMAASNAAKASLLGIAENNLKKIAAGAKSPEAQAQALALLGQLQVQKGQLEAGLANTAFDNNTQRMLANAQLGKAPATSASATALTEIDGRNQNIHNSGNKLLALIDAYGTSETIAPGVEGQMSQLANDMAVDAAKLKDPTSVARPGEVELELQNLFKPGMWQRDASAKAKIQAFLNNAEQRRATAYSVRGLQAPQARK